MKIILSLPVPDTGSWGNITLKSLLSTVHIAFYRFNLFFIDWNWERILMKYLMLNLICCSRTIKHMHNTWQCHCFCCCFVVPVYLVYILTLGDVVGVFGGPYFAYYICIDISQFTIGNELWQAMRFAVQRRRNWVIGCFKLVKPSSFSKTRITQTHTKLWSRYRFYEK